MTTTDTLSDLDWVMLARRSPNVFAAFVLGFEQAPVHKRLQRFGFFKRSRAAMLAATSFKRFLVSSDPGTHLLGS